MAPRACLVIAITIAACGGSTPAGAGEPSAQAPVPAGEWTLMRFLGGPPSDGQVTDTMHVDPASSRLVRIERNRAGSSPDRSCELEVPEGAAWSGLLDALRDPALVSASAPPRLVIDAGYFACEHAGRRLALSDLAPPEAALAPDVAQVVAALRRLSAAHARLHDEVVAAPACGSL